MSPAFRETKCGCHECSSVERLREIVREQEATIASLGETMKQLGEECRKTAEKLRGPYVQLYCGDCGKAAGVARKLSPALCAECLSKQFAPEAPTSG